MELLGSIEANKLIFKGKVPRYTRGDSGAVVAQIDTSGHAAMLGKRYGLGIGHHLVEINDTRVDNLSFNETFSILMNSKRPIKLKFDNPFAVCSKYSEHFPDSKNNH